jgi:hypothetical protein
LLDASSEADPACCRFADEIIKFNVLRMQDVFIPDPKDTTGSFHYDVARFAADDVPSALADYQLPRPALVRFEFTEEQRASLLSYFTLFGTSRTGVSRILSRVYIRRLLRQPHMVEGVALTEDERILLTGQASLTGLNEFE